MELCLQAHLRSCSPAVEHVKREYNQWADDLTNDNFTGFDQTLRLEANDIEAQWQVLPHLLRHYEPNKEQDSTSVPPPSYSASSPSTTATTPTRQPMAP